MWAVIGDIQKQVVWGGKLRDGETWKNLIAFQALKEIAEEDGKSFNGNFYQHLIVKMLLALTFQREV